MINVVSPNNTRLTLVRKLSDKKYRDRYGLFVAEGEKLVKDAFRHGLKAEFVLCSRAYAEKREAGEQSFLSAPCFVADDRIFGKLCDTVTNQGVLAVVRREKKELSSPEGKCLLLDGLQDPANVGAVLRTAAASGYDDVYLCGCADPFRRKACVRECPRSMFSIFSRAKGKKYSICFPAVSLYAPICRAKTYLPPTLRKSTRWFSAAKAAASAAPRVCGAKKP